VLKLPPLLPCSSEAPLDLTTRPGLCGSAARCWIAGWLRRGVWGSDRVQWRPTEAGGGSGGGGAAGAHWGGGGATTGGGLDLTPGRGALSLHLLGTGPEEVGGVNSGRGRSWGSHQKDVLPVKPA
jgi:hypothetical protein